jgi:hypothetical protein
MRGYVVSIDEVKIFYKLNFHENPVEKPEKPSCENIISQLEKNIFATGK